jgi:hypothetical protein
LLVAESDNEVVGLATVDGGAVVVRSGVGASAEVVEGVDEEGSDEDGLNDEGELGREEVMAGKLRCKGQGESQCTLSRLNSWGDSRVRQHKEEVYAATLINNIK